VKARCGANRPLGLGFLPCGSLAKSEETHGSSRPIEDRTPSYGACAWFLGAARLLLCRGLLGRTRGRMISPMAWRIGKLASALLAACSFALATAPAHAQDSGGWFEPAQDDASADAPPVSGDAPAARPQDPGPAPEVGPQTPPPAMDGSDADPGALQEFRPTLDPYGMWVNDPKYGTVWVPNSDVVGSDFAPYVSAGHWALAADGDWVWESDYPFGGVVFHYGRWVWTERGWAWIPGRQYANAWVTWRVASDGYPYVGWAPYPPSYGWFGGSAIWFGFTPRVPYVFCPSAYVFARGVHFYVVRDRYVVRDIAYHTQRYGSYGGGGSHVPASPHGTPGSSAPPRGPSLQAAHIPSYAVPTQRVSPRSAGYTQMTASARVGSAPSARFATQQFSSRGVVSTSGPNLGARYAAPRSDVRSPSVNLRSSMSGSGRVNYGSAAPSPLYRAPAPAARDYRAPSQPSPAYRAPSSPVRGDFRSSPASSPSYTRAPSVQYSAPRQYSAPSAPSYTRAPSVQYSAPRSSSSFAPMRSSAGGGGGGHMRAGGRR
jgi:hypothetical protein